MISINGARWCAVFDALHRQERAVHCTAWKFTLFSITFSLYGFLTLQEYYQLYRETWRTVKSVDPELQFGGPGIEGSLLLNTEDQTVSVFLQQCLADGCIPDFLTMHSFPHSFDEIASDFNRIVHQNDLTASFGLSSNENFMADALAALKQAAASLGLGNLPVWIDEWDSTIWQRDLCSDTCYKAVYIVKNMLENMDQTKGKAYWTVSDLINDWKIDGKLFHGGHGLITYNGIPKASFMHMSCLPIWAMSCLTQGMAGMLPAAPRKFKFCYIITAIITPCIGCCLNFMRRANGIVHSRRKRRLSTR